MMMTAIAAASLALSACGSAGTNEGKGSEAPAAKTEGESASQTYSATGKVDSISGRDVTISHEAIDALEWPAMTMTFSAKDDAQISGLTAGDQVSFAFRKSGSASTLTSISKQ